jgi:hypothetical protein
VNLSVLREAISLYALPSDRFMRKHMRLADTMSHIDTMPFRDPKQLKPAIGVGVRLAPTQPCGAAT